MSYIGPSSPDISCKSSVKHMIHMKCQDLFSVKIEKNKLDCHLPQILHGLNGFTTYDNIKAFFGILCFAHVSLINDTRAFSGIATRSKLVDSYSINFNPLSVTR